MPHVKTPTGLRNASATPRIVAIVVAATALAMSCAFVIADDKKAAPEAQYLGRVFEGESKNGKLQEALDDALSKVDMALGEGGVADAKASWEIIKTTGERGGIAGARVVKVKLAAKRSPPWDKE